MIRLKQTESAIFDSLVGSLLSKVNVLEQKLETIIMYDLHIQVLLSNVMSQLRGLVSFVNGYSLCLL